MAKFVEMWQELLEAFTRLLWWKRKVSFVDKYGEASLLFQDIVDVAANENDGFIIKNHDTADALYLCKVLLRTAATKKQPVTLVSGRLFKPFYNQLVDELEAVIEAGCPFKAYVVEADKADESGDREPNHFADRLRRQREKDPSHYDFQCKKLPKKTIPQVLLVGKNGEAFRFEKDPKKHAAVAAFDFSDQPVGKDLAEFVKERLEKLFAPGTAAA